MSEVDDGLKVSLANTVIINAYKEGIAGNGKPLPDGASTVKIKLSGKKES